MRLGKATGGLVQHGFCKMRGYSIMIMWNFLANGLLSILFTNLTTLKKHSLRV